MSFGQKPWIEIRRKVGAGHYRVYATAYKHPLRVWALGRWIVGACQRGKHDLQPIIAPGCVNVGTCRCCGTLHVLQHGERAQWTDTAAAGSTEPRDPADLERTR